MCRFIVISLLSFIIIISSQSTNSHFSLQVRHLPGRVVWRSEFSHEVGVGEVITAKASGGFMLKAVGAVFYVMGCQAVFFEERYLLLGNDFF